MKFKSIKVSAVADPILGGTPKRSESRYWGGDIKWASAKDVAQTSSRYITETLETITEEGVKHSAAKVLPKDTIVITARGTVGEMRLLGQPMAFNQSCYGLVSKDNIDNMYLFYALKYITDSIKSASYGTVFDTITKKTFDLLKIPYPSYEEQIKFSSILDSLDRKIELNQKMNTTLEEMAMTLYKHWFIDFGPFQDEEFVESELGMIPKGWTIHKYSDLLDSYIGGDWGKDEPNEIENVEVGVIRGADFDKLSNGEFGNIPKRFIKTNSFDKRRMMERDIIIENSVNSSTRCVGKSFIVTKELINILGTNLICASFCKLFRLKEKKFASLAYLHLNYLYDTGKMEDYQNVSSNGIGNFQAKEFVKMEGIPMPNDFKQIKDIIDTFNNIIDQISLNRSEVFQLSSLRDYLLPRLLSGEIDLSKAEKQVEKVL